MTVICPLYARSVVPVDGPRRRPDAPRLRLLQVRHQTVIWPLYDRYMTVCRSELRGADAAGASSSSVGRTSRARASLRARLSERSTTLLQKEPSFDNTLLQNSERTKSPLCDRSLFGGGGRRRRAPVCVLRTRRPHLALGLYVCVRVCDDDRTSPWTCVCAGVCGRVSVHWERYDDGAFCSDDRLRVVVVLF